MATPGQLQMYNKMEIGEMFGLDHRAMDERSKKIHRVHIYPDEKVPDACTFHMWLEDHTLGNLIRLELLRNDTVLFAGYKVPHPLNHMIELRVQTLPTTTPEIVVRHAITNLKSECRSMLDQFDSQLAEIEAKASKEAVHTREIEDRIHSDTDLAIGEGTTSGPEQEMPYSPYSPGLDDRDQRFQEQLEEFERLAGQTSASFSPSHSPTTPHGAQPEGTTPVGPAAATPTPATAAAGTPGAPAAGTPGAPAAGTPGAPAAGTPGAPGEGPGAVQPGGARTGGDDMEL